MKRLVMTPAILVIALSWAGCGRDESGSVSDTAAEIEEIDACALLTAGEIETATGIAAGAPAAMDSVGMPMCGWPTADGKPSLMTVSVAPSDNYKSFESAIAEWGESAKSMGFEFDPADYQQVEGVGDVGVWIGDGPGGTSMLQAHRGRRMVQIYILRIAPDRDRLQASKELAVAALGRLP